MNRQANGGPGRPGSPVRRLARWLRVSRTWKPARRLRVGQAQWPARRQARRLSRIMVAAGAAVLMASTGTAAAGTAFAGTAAQAVPVHPAALPSGTALSAARGSGVPRPLVIGPITGGAHGRPFTSSPLPLKPAGYVQQEFFLRGTATGYLPVGKWRSNGRWTARPAETAPYETR